MPIKKAKQFDSWSYSRLTEWEKCPFKAAQKHLHKIAEPESDKGAEGTAAHKDAELYASGQVFTCPPRLARFKDEFAALRKIKRSLLIEYELALDNTWKPTTWFNTFGKPAPWVRIKMDLTYVREAGEEGGKPKSRSKKAGFHMVREIVDYKNGVVRKEDEDQLELYGIGGLSMEPLVDVVRCGLWYLKEGVIVPETGKLFTRAELPSLIKRWAKRAAPMLADTAFVPKPGRHCTWCHLPKAKGGPCPF